MGKVLAMLTVSVAKPVPQPDQGDFGEKQHLFGPRIVVIDELVGGLYQNVSYGRPMPRLDLCDPVVFLRKYGSVRKRTGHSPADVRRQCW